MNKNALTLLVSSLFLVSAHFALAESGPNQFYPCGNLKGQNGVQLIAHQGMNGNGTCYIGLKNDLLDKINQTTNSNTEAVNNLNNHVSNTDKNVAGNSNAINDLNNHVSNTDKNVAGNSNAINSLNNHIKDTDKNVANNSNAINDLNNHVSNTDKNVAGNSNAINNLNNHIKDTDKNVANNSNAINELNNHVSNTDKNVTNNSNAIHHLQNSAVVYDDPTQKNKVTFNPEGDQVTLSNVADGQVVSSSKEAINGGQLWQTNQNVAANSNAINDLNHHLAETDKTVNSHHTAIHYLDNRVTNHENIINHIVNGSAGLVQTDGQITTLDKEGSSAIVSIAGANGNRVLTGVASGAVNQNSTEAINGSQLYAVYQQLQSDHHQSYQALSKQMERNRQTAAKGIASAMAMQIDMPDEAGRFTGGVGLGTYDGETALAFGSHYLSADGKYKYSAAISSNLSGQVKIGGKLSFGFRF